MTPIIVVTRGDLRRIHTLRLLREHNVDHRAVVHDNRTRDCLAEHGVECEIVVSGTRTLVQKRNWILKNMVSQGHWFIGMDDNISAFTMVSSPFYGNGTNATQSPPPEGVESWRRVYNEMVPVQRWLMSMQTEVEHCHEDGIPLFGVATMENPYFRERKYSSYRFVKSKVFAMRNMPDLRWKHEMCHDSYLSALCVARYGRVRVNSFMHYYAKMYEEGGLGDRKQREKLGLLEQMDAIIAEFPELVTIGRGDNTALRFRLVTENGVRQWRHKHGYLSTGKRP